jgi:hypothetical protein
MRVSVLNMPTFALIMNCVKHFLFLLILTPTALASA